MLTPLSIIQVKEFRHSIGFGVLLGLLSFLMMIAPGLQAQTGGQRDCDANAVIRCGALSANELRQKYNSQSDAQAVFSHMGINGDEMANSNWRRGHVTNDGKVVVNGRTVATNAMTAGRQNMQGSRAVTVDGTTFYVRPTSASFAQGQLDAMVAMKDGRFQHAVLTSCGNPVKAKPVPKPVAKQKKEKPQKKKVVEKRIIQQQEQSQSQSQQVTVNNQAPPPPPAPPAPPAPVSPKEEVPQPVPEPVPEPEPAPVAEQPVEVPAPAPVVSEPAEEVPAPSAKAEVPQALPDTGPGPAIGISALATVGGAIWYAIYTALRSRFF